MPRIGVVGGGAVLILAAVATIRSQTVAPLQFAFTDIAARAGLTARTVYGGERSNRYLIETTGSGAAAFDYDGDGWIDIFLVNGSTLEGFPAGAAPTSHLYRNRRDGTFEDVTTAAGLGLAGWGQGACAADYDNDGDEDLAVTFWGRNRLMRNRGDGTFEDATQAAGLETAQRRWGTGCAFLDYDRDGQLDLFVANYIDFDVATAPVPESGLCRYKGLAVACGPPGPDRREERAVPQRRRRSGSPTSPSPRASPRPAAPTASASAPSTSTTTAGSISTSPTTRARARSIATTATAR